MRSLTILLFTILSLFAHKILCQTQHEVKDIINQYLDNYYHYTADIKAYVHTDKYVYEKGENIWLTAIVADRFTHQPLTQNESIAIELVDDTETMVWGEQLTVKQGKAKTTIPVTNDYTEGAYTLRVFYANTTKILYRQSLLIKEHAIPYHLVNVHHKDKYYQGGEKININLSATDYFKNPLKRAKYEFVLMNGNKVAFADKGRLDKSGKNLLDIDLPNPISEDGLSFNLIIEHTRIKETLHGNIPTRSENIKVFFFPEGGSLVQGLKNKMTIKAYGPKGKDFSFAGILFNSKNERVGEVKSDDKGVATFTFTPNNNHEALNLQITSPYVVNKIFSLPAYSSSGASLSLLNNDGHHIELQVSQFPKKESTYYLGLINQGKIYQTQKIVLDSEKNLTFSSLKPGINKLTLFNQALLPVSEIMTYIPDFSDDHITTSFDADNYKNRGKVTLNINSAKDLHYAFSAVDEYRVFPLKNLPNILSHFTVGSELNRRVIINPDVLTNQKEHLRQINHLLSYSAPADSWKEIYASNNDNISLQQNADAPLINDKETPVNFVSKRQGQTTISNFTDDVYYLASNPLLIEKLNEKKKLEKRKPYYKQQLENGTSLRNVIHTIKPYEVLNGKIVFMGSRNSLYSQGGALIVLDGVKLGENISSLDQISPFDVEDIFVSTKASDIQNHTGLNSVGIIEINTKRGHKPSDNEAEHFEEDFQSPDYSKIKTREPDLRTTIYYSPFSLENVFPNNITFYHSDIRTNVVGRLEGIDANGNVIYRKSMFESFNYSKENQ